MRAIHEVTDERDVGIGAAKVAQLRAIARKVEPRRFGPRFPPANEESQQLERILSLDDLAYAAEPATRRPQASWPMSADGSMRRMARFDMQGAMRRPCSCSRYPETT